MNGDRIIQLIVAGIPILVGLYILGRAFVHLRSGSQRKAWPHTNGEIVTSEVQISRGADGDLTYFPVVFYRYKVNLVEYKSNIITASAPPSVGMQGYAEALVKKYQVNNKVDVYYDPDNPQEAVLETGISIAGILLIAIGGIIVFLCGLGIALLPQ